MSVDFWSPIGEVASEKIKINCIKILWNSALTLQNNLIYKSIIVLRIQYLIMWVNLSDPQNMSEDPSPYTRLNNYLDSTQSMIIILALKMDFELRILL